MPITVNSLDDLVIFTDIRKGFNVMTVKNNAHSALPTLKRTYECYNDIVVRGAVLWNIEKNHDTGRIDCMAVISTDDNRLQIYESNSTAMQLKAEINIGRKILSLKIVDEGEVSKNLVYFTQQGTIGLLSQINLMKERVMENVLFSLSGELRNHTILIPWQARLTPIHGCYFPQQYFKIENDWRKVVYVLKRSIVNESEIFLLNEMPIFIQQELLASLGIPIRDFLNKYIF